MLQKLSRFFCRSTKIYKESYKREVNHIRAELEDFRNVRKATETQRLKALSLFKED